MKLSHALRRAQRGATLIVGLIMIVLITLIVINAFNLSSSNLKIVNNMQSRSEAVAAANQAIEQIISSPFTNALGTQTFAIDINKDGATDYTVNTAVPVCTRAVAASSAAASDIELGSSMSASAYWWTDWELVANVSDAATGASTKVVSGVRLRVSQSVKDSACP